MKIRGQFTRGDGLVIPNNITSFGAQTILKAAMRGDSLVPWVGLVTGVPDAGLQIESLTEPTIGTNGYTRQGLTQDSGGWPNLSEMNGETYIQSAMVTFTASGGNFDHTVSRLMLVLDNNDLTGDVFALSAAFDPIVIGPSTSLGLRQFRYSIFMR